MTARPEELNRTLEVVLKAETDLGEGPIWDDVTGTLLFVDQTVGRIHRFDPATGALRGTDVGQVIGAAIPRRSGGLVVSSRDGLLAVDEGGGPAKLLVPIETDNPDNRMNDAKCDSRGRLWTGTFSTSFIRKAGALYRVDPDLTLVKAVDGVSISNGIAWNADESLMYYVDTAARGVDVFDYDIDTGAASNRRRFVDIDRAEGFPDGITVDTEGHLWVALYRGGAVRRYAPDGEWVGVITLPVANVTSCGFGGPALEDLYLTTAILKTVGDGQPHEALAGALFRCRPAASGMPEGRFAG